MDLDFLGNLASWMAIGGFVTWAGGFGLCVQADDGRGGSASPAQITGGTMQVAGAVVGVVGFIMAMVHWSLIA